MGDEEYYFEDENEGGGAEDNDNEEEELTWEDKLENKYADAKGIMDAKPKDAQKLFEECIADDQDHGRWSFKALKQLMRCGVKLKENNTMLGYYDRMLKFRYAQRTRNDVEKAINKFLDRCCSNMDSGVLTQIYDTTLGVVEQDKSNYEKLWFNIKMRKAQLTFNEKDWPKLTQELAALTDWCNEGENTEQRKGTQILTVIALEIQMYTELEEKQKLRTLYNKANSIKSAILPPKLMGIIRECGGKMFMRQSQWAEANDAFLSAFRSFDEAGHPRRISCLKYLVLATMLSGSNISPFATPEAQSYQTDPEIVTMTDLINACEKNDIRSFEKALKDKKNSAAIMQDTFLKSYLEPLVKKIRCQVLRVLSKPYNSLKIHYIATHLSITPREAEALCVSMILDGKLNGSIDQIKGVIYLHNEVESTGLTGERYRLLNRWANQQELLQSNLSRKTATLT